MRRLLLALSVSIAPVLVGQVANGQADPFGFNIITPPADDPAAPTAPPSAKLPPNVSTDTMPVEFSVGGIKYRMPRNYLEVMDDWQGGPQRQVMIRVNIPKLEPMSDQTRDCFIQKPYPNLPYDEADCNPVDVRISGPGTPTTKAGTDELIAKLHAAHMLSADQPQTTPFGFDYFEILRDNVELAFYRKMSDERMLLYMCLLMIRDDGARRGQCTPSGDQLSTGAMITFSFQQGLFANGVDKIDASLRTLIEGFSQK
jgi:hypothetical protein